jgi:hypothetical protein
VGVSLGVHEGQDWAAAVQMLDRDLRALFGAKVHLWGYLADDALSATIQQSTMVAMFFPDGVRANNTTAWTVLAHGVPLLTNLDPFSPSELIHEETVFDIHQLETWPGAHRRGRVATHGRMIAEHYNWTRLASELGVQIHA